MYKEAHDELQGRDDGQWIGGGSTCAVYLLPSGNVQKRPRPAPTMQSNAADHDRIRQQALRELAVEGTVYHLVGDNPRFVRMLAFDAEDGLTLEYMPNGNLPAYMQKHGLSALDLQQRIQWACDAAEAVHILHNHKVTLCSLQIADFLVDSDKRLRLVDFAAAAVDGQASLRALPSIVSSSESVQTDMFLLGSVVYEVMTGNAPSFHYNTAEGSEHERLVLPDTNTITCGNIISRCWRAEYDNTEDALLWLYVHLELEYVRLSGTDSPEIDMEAEVPQMFRDQSLLLSKAQEIIIGKKIYRTSIKTGDPCDVVGFGASSNVYRTDINFVEKRPHLVRGNNAAGWFGMSCRDLEQEHAIYQRLAPHPRLIRMIRFVPYHALTLEYLPIGNVYEYLKDKASPPETLSLRQRLQWACDGAEGLHHLHINNVVHCNMCTMNLLIDSEMRLRIIDFAGSSIDDKKGSCCEDPRHYMPRSLLDDSCTVTTDLFALGSFLYEVLTGSEVYAEWEDEEVTKAFKDHQFPDVSAVPCGHAIRRCWDGGFSSAEDVRVILHERLRTELEESPRMFPWQWML